MALWHYGAMVRNSCSTAPVVDGAEDLVQHPPEENWGVYNPDVGMGLSSPAIEEYSAPDQLVRPSR